MVMDVQAPSAAMRRSYGPGPLSEPPTANGSSATSRWGPTVISCANPLMLPRTVASLDAASPILRSPSIVIVQAHPLQPTSTPLGTTAAKMKPALLSLSIGCFRRGEMKDDDRVPTKQGLLTPFVRCWRFST